MTAAAEAATATAGSHPLVPPLRAALHSLHKGSAQAPHSSCWCPLMPTWLCAACCLQAALQLGMRATRRPAGYWSSLEVLDMELDAFIAGQCKGWMYRGPW